MDPYPFLGQASLFFFGFPITGEDSSQYTISYTPVNPLPPNGVDSLGITYTPTIEGLHPATLTILSNAPNNPALPISLRGTGILPKIAVTPSILSFDSTAEGDTVCKNITIANPGSDTLKLFSNFLSSNDGDFHYTALMGSLVNIAPGDSEAVSVCFIPLHQGFREARLLLETNIIPTFDMPRQDTAGTVTIDIQGTAIPHGILASSISSQSQIDTVLVGNTVCQPDTIWNNGDANIAVTQISLGPPNANNFTIGGITYPLEIAAHSYQVVSICARPDSSGFRKSMAMISGTTNGDSIAESVPLGVYGVNECASNFPSALFAGDTGKVIRGMEDTMCVTITNCGQASSVYRATLSGVDTTEYRILSQNPSPMIAPNSTYDFCVEFSPVAVGPTQASLNVTAPDIATLSVPLTGEGTCAQLTHDSVSIPNTGVNENRQFTFSISNIGTAPWTPGTEVIAGAGAAAFKLISIVPTPIPAGGQATVTMEFTPPLGSAGQNFAANISWPTGGPCEDAVVSADINGNAVVSGVKEIVNEDGFRLDPCYPNPASHDITFSYTTPIETEVRITLVDQTGKLSKSLMIGRVSDGTHLTTADLSDLANGTYDLLLESGNVKLIRQFVLIK